MLVELLWEKWKWLGKCGTIVSEVFLCSFSQSTFIPIVLVPSRKWACDLYSSVLHWYLEMFWGISTREPSHSTKKLSFYQRIILLFIIKSRLVIVGVPWCLEENQMVDHMTKANLQFPASTHSGFYKHHSAFDHLNLLYNLNYSIQFTDVNRLVPTVS